MQIRGSNKQLENHTYGKALEKSRIQIDYTTFKDRFRNCIKQAKTYHGADMNSDHTPAAVKVNMKLKKTNGERI